MNNPALLQRQIQQSANDQQFFLRDLNQWENKIKIIDKQLLEDKSSDLSSEDAPIRNKKNAEKTSELTSDSIKNETESTDDESDEDESEGSVNSEDEEVELQRCKQRAILEKEKGNQFYKAAKYDEAILSYTTGIQLDPMNPMLMANRALAFLKKEQFGAAAEDCRLAIDLDPTYVKAYHRRAVARKALSLYSLAKEDLLTVLEMEPRNKDAIAELSQIEKILEEQLAATPPTQEKIKGQQIFPVEKPVELQSKKPLKLIKIEEIVDEPIVFGSEDATPISITKLTPLKEIATREIGDKSLTNVPVDGNSIQTDLTSHGVDIADPVDNSVALAQEPVKQIEITELESDTKSKNPASQESPSKSTDICEQKSDSGIKILDLKLPEIPAPPKSSYQFVADFRKVKAIPELLYAYVKQIPSSNYPYIFQNCLESDVFSLLISVYHDYYMWNDDDIYEPLFHLSETKRFSMLKLFFTADDKKSLQELFQYMKKVQTKSEAELNALSHAYGCV